jgi:NTE family protein
MSDRRTLARVNAHRVQPRPAFACIALVLQGGGALGAYQAGVYQALGESGLQLDWVAGISIGAINAALIAGNAPDDEIEKLRPFWEGITARPNCEWNRLLGSTLLRGDAARQWHNQISAGLAFLAGAPGFFSPRIPVPWLNPAGTLEAMSVFDTSRLKQTLEQLVDFDPSTAPRRASALVPSMSAPATSSTSTTGRIPSAQSP